VTLRWGMGAELLTPRIAWSGVSRASSVKETAPTDDHSVHASVPNRPSTDAPFVRNLFGCMDLDHEFYEETGGPGEASGIDRRD